MKPVGFHPKAHQEVDEAFSHYENARERLGYEFLEALKRASDQIQDYPAMGTPIGKTKRRGYVLQEFPYIVYHRELQQEIRIVAVAHTKRQPGYWKRRRP